MITQLQIYRVEFNTRSVKCHHIFVDNAVNSSYPNNINIREYGGVRRGEYGTQLCWMMILPLEQCIFKQLLYYAEVSLKTNQNNV